MTQKEFLKLYPEGKIKGKWLVYGGDLICYNNQLKELPDNLKVSDNLDCSFNHIKELPDNLKVGGRLNYSFNQIKESAYKIN